MRSHMKPGIYLVTAFATVLIFGSPSFASQQLEVPSDRPIVRQALDYLRDSEEQTIGDQIALCEIPAPPFGEAARGEAYRERFAEIGLANVRIDEEGNVLGEIGEGQPRVVLSAHLDTVFPAATDVTVRREDSLLLGPGIGDDCRGLAVVLGVARAMKDMNIEPLGTLLFVGTVGEEGPGDLRGVKRLFSETLADSVDYFISVDGTGYGITHAAVGSNRYEVTFSGPGGHSYGAFGMPNPIHALGRAIAKISEFPLVLDPKTTFSVGLVEGGTSVNSIAFEVTMTVDLRSESPTELAELDSLFRSAVNEAREEEIARWSSDAESAAASFSLRPSYSPVRASDLQVDIVNIGVRPAADQPMSMLIIQAALAAAEVLGFEAPAAASSTDSNIPMSLGIPSVTIDGGGAGRGAHSLEERFDTTDSYLGTQWALLLALTLVGAGVP